MSDEMDSCSLTMIRKGCVRVKAVIELDHVIKKYGSITAVNDISFRVNEGEIFGVIGPNGAGKTTTIEIIEGLRTADSGTVKVLGLDVRSHMQQIKQQIGVLLQATSIPERAKVKEILRLFHSLYAKPMDIKKVSSFFGLEDKLNAGFKSLSGGWKQRVSLALALINDPRIVFLDEPSMGLDPNARREMWDMILRLREEGRTILVTTHYMEEAETLCDRVAVIDKGRLIALDTPSKLMTQIDSKRRITFKTDDHMTKSTIGALPHVTDVEWEKDFVTIHTTDVDLTLKHLYRLAENENWMVRELKLANASMNDVFNQLTHSPGGDAA